MVRLLIEHGAKHDEPIEIDEAEPPPDARTILRELSDGGNADALKMLESMKSGDAMEHGHVLPIRSMPKSALAGIPGLD